MQKTADLLTKALSTRTPSQWAKALNVTPSAITNARQKGRLSPGMAANIAAELGESPGAWALVAAQENEKEADLWEQLRRRMPTWNNVHAKMQIL